ncbi:hypothetical protein PLIIFM63780_005857 [Purpureocillium lilacinum]|nr:hypothetical protein PLIIFM63780_005857 [Purpureocillium lilacinum]
MAQPVASVEGLLSPDTPEEQHALHSFADAIPGAEAGEGAGARLRSPTLQDLIDVAAQELRAMQNQNHSASSPLPSAVQSPTGVAAAMPEWDGTSREKLQHQYRCEMEDVRASLYLVEGALRDIRAQNRRRWSTQMDVIRSIAITAPDAVGEGQTVGGIGGFDGAGAGMMMDFAAAAAENGGDDANAAAGLAFAHQHNAHHGHGQHYPFNDGAQGHAGGALTDMGSMTSRQSFSSTSSDPATSFSEQDGFASAPTAADIYPISPLEAAQHDGSAGDTTTTNLEQHDSHEKPVQNKKSKSKKKTLRPVKPKAALSPPTTTGAKRRQASNNRPMPVKKAGKSGGNATATRSKTRAASVAASATQQQVSPSESDDDAFAASFNENAVEDVDMTVNETDGAAGSGDENEEADDDVTDDDMDLDEHTSTNNTAPTAATASTTAAAVFNGRKTKKQGQNQQLKDQQPAASPRYAVPRHKGARFASGPAGRPFRFQSKPRTVAGIWCEYKEGTGGNPAIEALEREHGTGWRRGDLRARKYASNYVGGRRAVVEYVERLARDKGWAVDEAIRRVDERVDGRISALTDVLRREEDPFEVLSMRVGGKEVVQ